MVYKDDFKDNYGINYICDMLEALHGASTGITNKPEN